MRTFWFVIPLALHLSGGDLALGSAKARMQLEDFGHQKIAPVSNEPTSPRVRRPVLVILAEYEDRHFEPGHDLAYYRRLLFGPGYPNVKDFYAENSRGNFEYVEAGIIGPLPYYNDPRTRENEALFDCTPTALSASGKRWCPHSKRDSSGEKAVPLQVAREARFDFRPYDSDGNGIITERELHVLMVVPGPPGAIGGQVHFAASEEGSCGVWLNATHTLQFCGYTESFGENAGLHTIAHESSHLLGTSDIYGIWAGANANASLMASVFRSEPGSLNSMHLDAWHKMRLGWNRPLLRTTTDAPTCVWMNPSHLQGRPTRFPHAVLNEPVLIGEPKRGGGQYFLLEHRQSSEFPNPESPGAPPMTSYDAGVSDRGLAIWHIEQDANGNSFSIPAMVFPPTGVWKLQTRVPSDSDDQYVPDDQVPPKYRIEWGQDGVLQSLPPPGGRDVVKNQVSVLILPPAINPTRSFGPGVAGDWGGNRFWRQEHGPFPLKWRKDGDSSVTVLTGVAENPNRPLPVAIYRTGQPMPDYRSAEDPSVAACLKELVGVPNVEEASLVSNVSCIPLPTEEIPMTSTERRIRMTGRLNAARVTLLLPAPTAVPVRVEMRSTNRFLRLAERNTYGYISADSTEFSTIVFPIPAEGPGLGEIHFRLSWYNPVTSLEESAERTLRIQVGVDQRLSEKSETVVCRAVRADSTGVGGVLPQEAIHSLPRPGKQPLPLEAIEHLSPIEEKKHEVDPVAGFAHYLDTQDKKNLQGFLPEESK